MTEEPPGRFYVYKSGFGSRVYEIKTETFREVPDDEDMFEAKERFVYEAPSRTRVKLPSRWLIGSTAFVHVSGWYDTLEEAVFAMEVLL